MNIKYAGDINSNILFRNLIAEDARHLFHLGGALLRTQQLDRPLETSSSVDFRLIRFVHNQFRQSTEKTVIKS